MWRNRRSTTATPWNCTTRSATEREFSQFQQAIALHGGPILDLCCQDMAHLNLPEQYGTVMIGATSIRLLQGPFETFFDHIYDQLKEGGCLCFDMENLPRQGDETMVTGDLVPITMADEEGDLSVILMQRRFDYQRGVAEVNMVRMRPDKERKVLLTATHYRLFGVDAQSAAACLRSYLKGRGVHSIAYTDDTLPSLNDLAEDVLSIADDGLVLVANQENKLLVNALACRIAQMEDLPIYLLYGGSELNCQAEETVTTIADGAPEETLTKLLGAAEGQPLMKCSPDAQRAALQHIQQRCRERDVLLVADEVATGFGRTGHPLRLAAGGDHPRPGLPVQGHQQRLPGGGTGDVPQGDRPEPAPLPGAADQSISSFSEERRWWSAVMPSTRNVSQKETSRCGITPQPSESIAATWPAPRPTGSGRHGSTSPTWRTPASTPSCRSKT